MQQARWNMAHSVFHKRTATLRYLPGLSHPHRLTSLAVNYLSTGASPQQDINPPKGPKMLVTGWKVALQMIVPANRSMLAAEIPTRRGVWVGPCLALSSHLHCQHRYRAIYGR